MTILQSNESTIETEIEKPQGEQRQHTLREYVEIAMSDYFDQLEGQSVTDLYELVISEVEAPLLEAVMSHCRDNQTKASLALGLNRGTLRKKLKKYGML